MMMQVKLFQLSKKAGQLPLVILCFVLAACGGRRDDPAASKGDSPAVPAADSVAQAGDLGLSQPDYEATVRGALWLDPVTTTVTADRARAIASDRLVERALEAEARRRGADGDPHYAAALRIARIETLALFGAQGLPAPDPFSLPSMEDEEIEPLYEKLKSIHAYVPQIRFNYIFWKTAGLDAAAKGAKRDELAALRDQFKEPFGSGARFEDLLLRANESDRPTTGDLSLSPNSQNLDPKIWDVLAGLRPGQVSEVVELPSGFFLFKVYRSSVISAEGTFEEEMKWSPVDKFQFSQMIAAPVFRLYLEYDVFSPAGLRLPSGPAPTSDTLLVEVAGERLTYGHLAAARALRGEPAPSHRELIAEVPKLLRAMTLAERARRLGLEETALASPAAARAEAAVAAHFIVNRIRAEAVEPSRDQLEEAVEQLRSRPLGDLAWGWRARVVPADPSAADSPAPIEVRAAAARLRERLIGGEEFRDAAAAGVGEGLKVELEPVDGVPLAELRRAEPAWPVAEPADGKPAVSDPVMTGRGFELLCVVERMEAGEAPDERVGPLATRIWREETAQSALRKIEEDVRAKLTLDESRAVLDEAAVARLRAARPAPEPTPTATPAPATPDLPSTAPLALPAAADAATTGEG